jgi:hypothetical protein
MNLGVPAAGWIFDRSQSYAPAFQLFAALALVAALLPLWLRAPRTASEHPPAATRPAAEM